MTVTRRFIVMVLALFGLSCATSLTSAQERKVDLHDIIARGQLKVALPTFDSVPFFYVRDGMLEGSDIDLARDIAAKIGVTVSFVRSGDSFDDVIDSISTGAADVAICKLSRTLTRARRVTYTRPYLVLKHALALNSVKFAELARGDDTATVLRDYSGSLGVIHGSSFAQFARTSFPKAKIEEFPSWETLVAALREGQVVAAYRDEFEIKKLLVDDPAASLTLRTISFTDLEDTIGIAMPAGAVQLAGFLDMYITGEVKTATVEPVLARYRRLASQSASVEQMASP